MARKKVQETTETAAVVTTEVVSTGASTIEEPKKKIKIGNPTAKEKEILRKIDRHVEVRSQKKALAEEDEALDKEIRPVAEKYGLEVFTTKDTEAKVVQGQRRSFELEAKLQILKLIGPEKFAEVSTIKTKEVARYVAETVLNGFAKITKYSYLKLRSFKMKPQKKSLAL